MAWAFIYFLMKNDCLVTILREFIVKCLEIFFLPIHAWDCCVLYIVSCILDDINFLNVSFYLLKGTLYCWPSLRQNCHYGDTYWHKWILLTIGTYYYFSTYLHTIILKVLVVFIILELVIKDTVWVWVTLGCTAHPKISSVFNH